MSSLLVKNATFAAEKFLLGSEKLGFGASLLLESNFSTANISLLKGDEDWMCFPFCVTPTQLDSSKCCAPGLLATFADVFTSLHLWGRNLDINHVSVHLQLKHFQAGCGAGQYYCHTHVGKAGNMLAFTDFKFIHTNALIAQGSHNKAFIRK